MNMKQVDIHQLIDDLSNHLEQLGYHKKYVWGISYGALLSIQKLHTINGFTDYHPSITAEFILSAGTKYSNGEISNAYWKTLHKAAERLDEYYNTGTLEWKRNTYSPPVHLHEYFSDILSKFMVSREFHTNTYCDFNWAIRKYLLFLQEKGFEDFSVVSVDDIRNFMMVTAEQVSAGSLSNIQCYVRQFHVFLDQQGIIAPDCVGLLSYHIPRHVQVKNYVIDDELGKILKQIDTNTSLGLRDYAIILLGATTGLRAIDIIQLNLSDIDWKKGEIHVIQAKTKGDLYLPLIESAGSAIKDYILYGRPDSDSNKVFLRSEAPYTGLSSAATVGYLFNKYLHQAGVERKPFDGKTFHGLRRRIGHNMLHSGIPVTTIAQVLGHQELNSTEQYLSLDTDKLKCCALDFKGICPKGGADHV